MSYVDGYGGDGEHARGAVEGHARAHAPAAQGHHRAEVVEVHRNHRVVHVDLHRMLAEAAFWLLIPVVGVACLVPQFLLELWLRNVWIRDRS